ncbi:histidine kinase [Paenalkalicoccus suaedae]|uniref:Histidine kinase n=1 Tax=Paenalkalicoccus suaedae TaxID=2592382 RepID=A0A859FHH0_9BACI|nr:histidine kinase [Paenalkalicoccus suaedae]QKS72559.1 histidine kinase [Paenalkalicoccus suaedae]
MPQTTSLKEKVRKAFMRYTLIPLLIVAVAVSAFFYFNSSQILIRQTEEAGQALAADLSEMHESYAQFIEETAQSAIVIDYLDFMQGESSLFQAFYEFNTQQIIQSDFFLFDKNESLVLSNAIDVDQLAPDLADYFLTSKRLLDRQESPVINRVNQIPYHNGRLSSYLYGAQIVDENEEKGYVFYLLHEEDFLTLLFQHPVNLSVITDPYDTIIATSNNSVRDFLNKYRPDVEEGMNVQIRDNDFVQAKEQIPGSALSVYTLNPVQQYSSTLAIITGFFLVLSLFIFIVLRVLSSKLSDKLTESINNMTESINQFKIGSNDYYLKSSDEEEMNVLAGQFNDMLDEIKQLIREKEELSKRQRESEIKHLELQFNPHFVFNVLESIRYSILIEPKNAEKSILALSKLLRYSVQKSDQEVLLVDELNQLQHYIDLHQLRFEDSLHYVVEVDPMLQLHQHVILLPRLLIQPLVENAIKHADPKGEALQIHVQMRLKQNQLLCTVIDNGKTCTFEKVDLLTKELQDENSSEIGLGLYNVHRRIQLLFPDNKGLDVAVNNGGLRVSFEMPLILTHERSVG